MFIVVLVSPAWKMINLNLNNLSNLNKLIEGRKHGIITLLEKLAIANGVGMGFENVENKDKF